MRTQFHVSYNPAFRGWQFYITRQGLTNGGRLEETSYLAKPLEFVEPNESAANPETLSATDEEVQQLMDALWRAGVRPKGQTEQDTNHMKLHLEDMRRLVFQRFDQPDPRPTLSEMLNGDHRQ